MPSIKYYCEDTIVEALHRLIAESTTCRVAVSYCGEAAYTFFPDSPARRPPDLRIVVDASETTVSRGLTNPKGIGHLLGLTSQMKSLAGLHAKAFIFDNRVAIVGSVNMSASSLEQYQLALEVTDRKIVRQLIKWFDSGIWRNPSAEVVTHETISKLMNLWPGGTFPWPTGSRKGRIPKWRGEVPEPPLGPSDFKIGISEPDLGKLLAEFDKNECPYAKNGQTCSQVSLSAESERAELGRQLRSLMRRRSLWDKADLATIFDIAFTNGRAAKMRKPLFVKQKPAHVARSLNFLLNGVGDPYTRFEKVLDPNGPYKLNGMAESGLAFLMHVWNPKEFSVVDHPVEKAFELLKVDLRRSKRAGQWYKDRTAATSEIAKRTDLKTFARVDHFLDAIGKGHIGLPRPRPGSEQ